MKLNERFPFLYHFFGAYFHRDWMDVYENEEMVIREYVFGERTEEVRCALHELDQLIMLKLSEPELRVAVVDDLGSDYYPKSKYQFMYEWLKYLRSTMAEYAEEKMAGGK